MVYDIHDMIRYDMTYDNTIRYDMIYMIRYDIYDTILCDMIRYDMIFCDIYMYI